MQTVVMKITVSDTDRGTSHALTETSVQLKFDVFRLCTFSYSRMKIVWCDQLRVLQQCKKLHNETSRSEFIREDLAT